MLAAQLRLFEVTTGTRPHHHFILNTVNTRHIILQRHFALALHCVGHVTQMEHSIFVALQQSNSFRLGRHFTTCIGSDQAQVLGNRAAAQLFRGDVQEYRHQICHASCWAAGEVILLHVGVKSLAPIRCVDPLVVHLKNKESRITTSELLTRLITSLPACIITPRRTQ